METLSHILFFLENPPPQILLPIIFLCIFAFLASSRLRELVSNHKYLAPFAIVLFPFICYIFRLIDWPIEKTLGDTYFLYQGLGLIIIFSVSWALVLGTYYCHTHINSRIIFGVIFFVVLFLHIVLYFPAAGFVVGSQGVGAAFSSSYFRTNILTKQCDYGGGGPTTGGGSPWWYREGCEVPFEEAMKVVVKKKGVKWLDSAFVQWCKKEAGDEMWASSIPMPPPMGEYAVIAAAIDVKYKACREKYVSVVERLKANQ